MKLYFDKAIHRLVTDQGEIIDNLEITTVKTHWDSNNYSTTLRVSLDALAHEDFLEPPPMIQQSI